MLEAAADDAIAADDLVESNDKVSINGMIANIGVIAALASVPSIAANDKPLGDDAISTNVIAATGLEEKKLSESDSG